MNQPWSSSSLLFSLSSCLPPFLQSQDRNLNHLFSSFPHFVHFSILSLWSPAPLGVCFGRLTSGRTSTFDSLYFESFFSSSLPFLSPFPSTSFSSESSSFEARFRFSRRRITDSHGILLPFRSSPTDRGLWEFRIPSRALPFSVSGVRILRLLLLLQV